MNFAKTVIAVFVAQALIVALFFGALTVFGIIATAGGGTDVRDDSWLVIDATTGQNGISQAREFGRATNLTGIVLTKLDGTARGGIAVAIAREFGLPIRWVGVGEAVDDLVPFEAEAYVDGLLGSAEGEAA